MRQRHLSLAAVLLVAFSADASAVPGKGVNYMTGGGMDQLNCAGSDTAQIAADMTQLKAIGVAWMRIEASITAISGLPKDPTCPPPANVFTGFVNLAHGVESIGARPIVDILEWHYPPALAGAYKAWLAGLLDLAPQNAAFEIGNEENLSYRVESYPGANPDTEPYGWDFDPHDFAGNDPVGLCPTDPAKLADLDGAVSRYVAWLADSAKIIRARRPDATIIIGGLSSYQPDCWLEKLGKAAVYDHADAIGYHPYPRYENTPQDGAGTLEDVLNAMAAWRGPLPIWITEYGFSTNNYSGNAVKSETVKADDLSTEFILLAPRVNGPILWYTARDDPTTAAEWRQDCAPHDCPGGVGGFGLFEWRNGHLIIEPADQAFAALPR